MPPALHDRRAPRGRRRRPRSPPRPAGGRPRARRRRRHGCRGCARRSGRRRARPAARAGPSDRPRPRARELPRRIALRCPRRGCSTRSSPSSDDRRAITPGTPPVAVRISTRCPYATAAGAGTSVCTESKPVVGDVRDREPDDVEVGEERELRRRRVSVGAGRSGCRSRPSRPDRTPASPSRTASKARCSCPVGPCARRRASRRRGIATAGSLWRCRRPRSRPTS